MTGFTEGSVSRGHEVPIVWRGVPILAWVPTPLAEQDLTLGSRATRLTERAAAAVAAAGNRSSHFGPIATLLLRSEGVASSYIEGLRALWRTLPRPR